MAGRSELARTGQARERWTTAACWCAADARAKSYLAENIEHDIALVFKLDNWEINTEMGALLGQGKLKLLLVVESEVSVWEAKHKLEVRLEKGRSRWGQWTFEMKILYLKIYAKQLKLLFKNISKDYFCSFFSCWIVASMVHNYLFLWTNAV